MASNRFDGTIQIGDQVFRAEDVSIEFGQQSFVEASSDYPSYRESFKLLPCASPTISMVVNGPPIGSSIVPLPTPEKPVVKSPAYPETGRRKLFLEEE